MSSSNGIEPMAPSALPAALKSQYHANLAMLREAIELCPDDEWASGRHTNAFWQVAYHSLYFTHLYLMPRWEDFRPWSGHRNDNQNPDGIAGPPDPNSQLPLIPAPYTKAQVLAYWAECDALVDDAVDALDLDSADCGFSWYKVSKLEHQLVNLRHLGHHTGQLADRVRASTSQGVRWVGAGRPKTAS